MSQFAGAKNPPWARPQSAADFIAVSASSSTMAANNQMQTQVANTIMPQPGVANPTVYSLGNNTPNMGAPQYTAQQLVGLQQAQQQAAAAAVLQQPPIQSQAPTIPQPGIAIPTTLATTQVATVSYPAPRASQPPGPKQRVFTGTITKLHDNFGFVDEDVFFQTSCVKGSQPKSGDRVLVEATFNPNMPFKWNATRIQVLPNQGPPPPGPNSGFSKQMGPMSVSGNMAQNMNNNMQLPSGIGSVSNISQGAQSLLNAGPPGMRGGSMSGRRNEPRFERNRDRKREMQDKRDRQERQQAPRKRSRSRSPAKRNDSAHQRSPARRRPRIVPRYLVQIPKLSFDMKNTNVISLKSRYTNLYIPSDFFHANFAWTEVFPLIRPFQLGKNCSFHLFHKDVDPVSPNDAILDPPDTDHVYSAKVMLMACPSLDELYHKSCALAEDNPEIQESFVHPTRLINFLVGLKGKNETMAIGGPWSPTLDGPNPGSDPRVLIRTAIRTTKALTGIDLSACTQWYRFVEIKYLRPEETHKGKHVQTRVETTVIFLPDVWSCSPTRLEWGTLQLAYKKQLQKKLSSLSNPGSKEENSQDDADGIDDTPREPTHFSELDPKTMKILDLRKELESRTLSSKGLKSQLIARLTKAIKSEEEAEKTHENMEAEEDATVEEAKKNLIIEEEKSEDKKKEEEEKKKKEEREKASLERKYGMSDDPSIVVHPNTTAKGGKFDCAVMSLSVLLDYRPEDNKEHSYEVSLFAELFNEMLMRDFGFEIYKALVKAPEKKEEDKKDKDKDKDKKSDDKQSKDSGTKKKKVDDKDKKDSDKKDPSKEKSKKDDEKNEDKKDEKIDDDENEDEAEEKGKKDKEKKKEKKKYVTKEPDVLLAFTYFDQNHTGYLLDKDVEEIIHTIGLQLSRAQVKKLVQKVISRDALNYRKLTDKPAPGQDVKEDAEDDSKDTSKVPDLDKLALGNKDFLQKPSEADTKSEVVKNEEEKEKEGTNELVLYKGSMLDVGSVMSRLDKSEKTRTEMEKRMQTLTAEKDTLKKTVDSKEEATQKLLSELKQLKQKLVVQERITTKSESFSKKYMSALIESKEHLTAMLSCVTDALGDKPADIKTEEAKRETESNGS